MGTSLAAEPLLALAVAVTSEQRVDSVLQSIVQGLASQPGVALARIWLLTSPDFPSVCHAPSDSPDSLCLVASAGAPINSPGEDWCFLHGHFARMSFNVGKVGQVAATRHPILVEDVGAQNDWIVRPEWAKREEIRSFAGHPLIFRDKLLGVIAVFSRHALGQQEFTWLGLFANQAAVAINNARAEQALQSSERNLAAIINTIPTTAWTTRPDGYCDFLNQVWLDYVGMTAEQAQGWGWEEAIHPDDRAQLVEDWESSLASGIPVDTEARIRRFDSSYRWFLIRANPLRDESGNILKWCGTCTEIEDHKRWEQILRARELSWRQIVDNIPGLVATTGAMGEVEFLNRQTLEYFGRTKEELKNWALIGAVHPDDLPRVIEVRKKSIETGQIYEVEHRCRRADGVYRWFQVRGLPVRDEENKVTAWYLLLTDIDDRKRAEEDLRTREIDARSSLDNMPAFLVRLSPAGTVEFVNRPFLEYFGKTLEEMNEWSTNDMIDPDARARVIEVFGNSLLTGEPFDMEYRLRRFDGVYRWFQTRANPVRSVDGRILHWNALARDIDDRKKAEEALNKTRSEFAHVARITTLNALTASVAHEINQPLASLITNASICLRRLNADPPNVDGARETVMRAIRDGNRASDVIARLRALYTKKEFTLEPLDLNDATQEVVALSLSDLQRNQIIVKSMLADGLPLINGDRVQLQQVILNLLRNASDAMGSVNDRPRELFVQTERDSAGEVRLSVKDVGLGFTTETADKLFQAFYTTKTDGMGIGLHVSHSIIEAHHGRLWAIANDGPGATFSFAIPSRPEALDNFESPPDRTDAA